MSGTSPELVLEILPIIAAISYFFFGIAFVYVDALMPLVFTRTWRRRDRWKRFIIYYVATVSPLLLLAGLSIFQTLGTPRVFQSSTPLG
ncbi:MAG TPA: hypothetical protein VMU35_05655 [Methylomirabilota bacterium]|nr:hypothetical protein [Methylomirabilota bacterium]